MRPGLRWATLEPVLGGCPARGGGAGRQRGRRPPGAPSCWRIATLGPGSCASCAQWWVLINGLQAEDGAPERHAPGSAAAGSPPAGCPPGRAPPCRSAPGAARLPGTGEAPTGPAGASTVEPARRRAALRRDWLRTWQLGQLVASERVLPGGLGLTRLLALTGASWRLLPTTQTAQAWW